MGKAKEDNRVKTNIRINRALYVKTKAVAEKKKLSINQIVNHALDKYVRDYLDSVTYHVAIVWSNNKVPSVYTLFVKSGEDSNIELERVDSIPKDITSNRDVIEMLQNALGTRPTLIKVTGKPPS